MRVWLKTENANHNHLKCIVIPAQAGIHNTIDSMGLWIPAYTGMTARALRQEANNLSAPLSFSEKYLTFPPDLV